MHVKKIFRWGFGVCRYRQALFDDRWFLSGLRCENLKKVLFGKSVEFYLKEMLTPNTNFFFIASKNFKKRLLTFFQKFASVSSVF